jgi:maltooligosyltrehalose trehalohydrolase
LYFCDYEGELADAITQGRRAEFAGFKAFGGEAAREAIPDPNEARTCELSRLRWEERDDESHRGRLALTRELLEVRAEHVAPRIPSITPGTAETEVREHAVRVRWPVRDGALQLEANLGDRVCDRASRSGEKLLYSTASAPDATRLQAWEVRLSMT